MAQLLTVRLNKSDQQPLGFRLQGGKDFGTPLVVQKVNGGSAAERAGLQAGDALIRVNTTDVYTLRHQEAQDAIRAAGGALELTVQRGGSTWRPAVTPTGSLPRPGRPLGASPANVTQTSLKANQQPSRAFGSGHNNVAKPFGYMNGGGDSVKGIVNKQYNTPVAMYSDKTIAETLSAQTEVLAGGVLGVNFKKNEKTYDSEKSAVFKMLQEDQNDPEPEVVQSGGVPPVSGLRHVTAPVTRPDAPINNTGGLPPGQNICEECERLITGVFVRIKDKNLHVECFKCSTCGSSLKNQGYYNLNGKLYCDIHAKLVARNNPPGPNLEPVTVPPGGRIPTNTYSTPLPPLATNNYTNGSSSLFSPSSNLSSGPKPFGSSLGSAYSPSLSPRSAPLSPARPVTAPAPVGPAHYTAPAPAPAHYTAPVAPYAPTNDTHHNSLHKNDFKSPAEERLIRKMAKMALNGYEIGIQRKIKPADHIQSMAEKIQDTVVTKHPLNTDNIPSNDCIRENTLNVSANRIDNGYKTSELNRSANRNVDNGYKTAENISILGDKIKDTIINNHPAIVNFTNDNIPVPPPIPTTPIPCFDSYSTSIKYTAPPKNPNEDNRSISSKLFSNFMANSYDTSADVDIVSNVGSSEDKSYIVPNRSSPKNENNFINTLQRSNAIDKSGDSFDGSDNISKQDNAKFEHKTDVNFSNTLSKRNIFEKRIEGTESPRDTLTKTLEKINKNGLSAAKPDKLYNNITEIKNDNTMTKQNNESNTLTKTNLPSNLYDNTLYHYKHERDSSETIHNVDPSKNGNDNNISKPKDNIDDKISTLNRDENEFVVKRRQKKNDQASDGRRDSHIIARPLSTMKSEDVAEGLYPVCHKCDKAITRGPFITALGRIWCPDHFICVNTTCRRQLQDIGFVEENGQLYCEFCFEQYIAPACDKCHGKIKGDCLNAIGKHFHPECFNCVYCGKLFGNNPFFLEDGLPYCEADWNELFTTKCFACGFPVEAGDRCARKTSKDRVSLPREGDHFARFTPVNDPQIVYNSDTVYSTTTFRPVSPSPRTPARTPPAPASSSPTPQRTRKLETPLYSDGGLFSDIRSTDGKLLSKVTVDRLHSSTRCDVTDSPITHETRGPQGSRDYVDDLLKTETITNEDVIKVKFTPVPPELLTPRTFTPQFTQPPHEYVKDNFEDLHSYKIVNMLCKESKLDKVNSDVNEGFVYANEPMQRPFTPIMKECKLGTMSPKLREKIIDTQFVKEPVQRPHSPLANLLVPEQLNKIDSYLQESLNACSGQHRESRATSRQGWVEEETVKNEHSNIFQEKHYHSETNTSSMSSFSSQKEVSSNYPSTSIEDKTREYTRDEKVIKSKRDSVAEKNPSVWRAIYNLPIHYHAAILCVILIIYNLIYQYIKENCHGKNK